MESLVGFKLDIWDYLTFLVLVVAVMGGLVFLVWMASLPGRIAIARKHPDAEAMKLLGYCGFLPVVPWIQAFVWAFKPADTVDIRRFPWEEAKAIDEEIARLKDEPEAAIYTSGMTGSWAALRRIGIRTTSWFNFLYPLPF